MWRYYLVYVGVLVAVGIFMFFCVPETKGLSLDEIRTLFDGQRMDTMELPVVASCEDEAETVRHATPVKAV
jgi:hypothetical protein